MEKVLIVVHGMGEHKRNGPLMGTVRPVLEVIRARGRPQLLRNLKVEGDSTDGRSSSVVVGYGDQSWRFVEYWWTEGFRPPSLFRAALWIFSRLTHHVSSLVVGLRRAWKELFESGNRPRDPLVARIYHAIAIPIYIAGLLVVRVNCYAIDTKNSATLGQWV